VILERRAASRDVRLGETAGPPVEAGAESDGESLGLLLLTAAEVLALVAVLVVVVLLIS
jgi:hypothetical protein